MGNRWKAVTLEQAKQHSLYGVGGWLVLFALGLALSLLRELGSLNSEATKAGMALGDFLSVDHPAISFIKFSLWLQVGMTAIIYWLMFSKHRSFRPVTTALLLGSWPVLALLGLVHQFPGLGEILAFGLVSWLISCAVWVTYLQRSKRIRVTFENLVLANDENLHGGQQDLHKEPFTPSDTKPMAIRVPNVQPERPVGRQAGESENVEVREAFWAAALAELESGDRRPGLWAKAFSEAQGDEARARANYLAHRSRELAQKEVAVRAQTLADEEARRQAQQQQAQLEEERLSSYRRSVNELDTASEAVIRYFVEAVPEEHRAFVFSLTNEVGGTLLHTAAREGFAELAEALLEKGADPAVPGPKGLLPHEVAEKNGHWRLAERIERSLMGLRAGRGR